MVLIVLSVLAGWMFFTPVGESAPRADAFIIELHGRKARVLSPSRHHPRTHLIIKNKTLSNVAGRLENAWGEVKRYVSVNSNDVFSFPLGIMSGERLFFVPLSPPLQAFELKTGNPSYEIPPQR